MKKRLVALLLTAAVLCAGMLSAYAAKGFDCTVMENGADIIVTKDEIGGIEHFQVKGLMENNKIETDFGVVTFNAMASTNSALDLYALHFQYYADDWAFIKEIIFKVGNKRYIISDINADRKIRTSSRNYIIQETSAIAINDAESIKFMEDLIAHREESIMVRLDGTERNIDFELPKEMKDGMIHLYNLYVQAGGTRTGNWLDPGTGSTMRVETIS